MDYWTGLCFLCFLNAVFSTPATSYTVHLDELLSFELAKTSCKSEEGFLTNMANQSETVKILKAIEAKGDKRFTSFWIGLMKDRTKCVQKDLPLKGFSWTVDNSTTFLANKWKSEPQGTCTNALCGLLSVTYDGSRIDSWQLDSNRCKNVYPFICKDKGQSKKKTCPDPEIHGTSDIMRKHYDPHTLQVTCNDQATYSLTCLTRTGKWILENNAEKDISDLCRECPRGKKDEHGNCAYVSSSTSSPDGFHDKTTSPSFQPDSTTENTVHMEEHTGDLSNIIVPVIIALLIFVVLVVIIVGIVKCCLIRRAKKRAKRRAEASKESMALNGSDSMEKVNEK